MAPHRQSRGPLRRAREGELPGKVGLGTPSSQGSWAWQEPQPCVTVNEPDWIRNFKCSRGTIQELRGGRGAMQVEGLSQGRTNEDSELRAHVSSRNVGRKSERGWWYRPAIPSCLLSRKVIVVTLARRSATCGHFWPYRALAGHCHPLWPMSTEGLSSYPCMFQSPSSCSQIEPEISPWFGHSSSQHFLIYFL